MNPNRLESTTLREGKKGRVDTESGGSFSIKERTELASFIAPNRYTMASLSFIFRLITLPYLLLAMFIGLTIGGFPLQWCSSKWISFDSEINSIRSIVYK